MPRFRVGVQLGSGFTGVVYQARDLATGETVALKEIRPEIDLPAREVALGRISHVNVCCLYDMHFEEGKRYIAMEFIDGETLRALVKREGALPAGRALEIIRQLLNGLESAHRRGVIHRDLKPENIMIDAGGTVKIMDFGHARQVHSEEYTHWDIPLSKGYAAPEQVMGKSATASSDIYSVGAIFYEMVAGKPVGDTILHDVPGVRRHIGRAIRRCLAMEPSRRIASVEALREALAEPVLFRPVPHLVFAIAIVLAVLTGVSFSQWRLAGGTVALFPQPARKTVAVFFDGAEGEAFTAGLVKNPRYRVVQRKDLEKNLDQLQPADRKGIVGADYMFIGSASPVQGGVLLSVKLMETETTTIVLAKGATASPADVLRSAEELAGQF